MGISCCAFGCKERFVKGGKVTFHSFPKDEEKRRLWVRNLRRENFVPSSYSRICSKHFEEECFDRNRFGGTWLTPEAIPTIFAFPKHLKQKTVKRKHPAVRTINTSNIVDSDHHKEPVVTLNVDVVEPSSSKEITYRYIGDFQPDDMNCPVKAKKALELAKKTIMCKQIEIKKLRREQFKLKRKLEAMQPILEYLKNKDLG